jgi:hypothetical protein
LGGDIKTEEMNERKEGRKYRYPDSFIHAIGCIKFCFHLPCRQREGIIKATGNGLPHHPSFSQINRRINRLDIDGSMSSNKLYDDGDDDKDVVIDVDSTGIKVTNRGQWITEKWGTHNNNSRKKKGHIKIHVAGNTKTKETLALEVTDEKVHDGKEMKALVERVPERSKGLKIKTVLADGAYDSNGNFKCIQEKKIQPGIRVRKNPIITCKNSKTRNVEVRNQTRDLLKWKRKRGYGKRWMAETVFSSMKRTYGEHVSATKIQNMVKEIVMKIYLYNLFRRIA